MECGHSREYNKPPPYLLGRALVADSIMLDGIEPTRSGKVRDIYRVDGKLLLVASDRISAYDVVLPDPIPEKGKVLTGLSAFWFSKTSEIVPNHLLMTAADDFPGALQRHAEALRGRSMLCRELKIFPVECVVRGYLAGSGWREYERDGSVCGIDLPDGLKQSEKLPEPIFTPATKAEAGEHDENIDADFAADILGSEELFNELQTLSLKLYEYAANYARERGIILADSKFEFGHDSGGNIVLADELFTPDSSRFWPADDYKPGRSQTAFDKQYVRDWLDKSGWDHSPPAPRLPDDVIENTRARYIQAYELITGDSFDRWLEIE